MCGRFAITLPNDAMAQLFAAQLANALPQQPNYNICPTTAVHVVQASEVGRQLVSMRWGFLPHWYPTQAAGPLLINARAETIAAKPAFAAASRARRCLIPATGFYEWTKDDQGHKLPWYIHRRDGAPMAFAAIWQSWGLDDPINTVAIVTTAANQTLSSIHHRMPLILESQDWPLWLGEAGHGAAELMRPGDESVLDTYRVDPAVNSNRASGLQLIEPWDPKAAPADRLI